MSKILQASQQFYEAIPDFFHSNFEPNFQYVDTRDTESEIPTDTEVLAELQNFVSKINTTLTEVNFQQQTISRVVEYIDGILKWNSILAAHNIQISIEIPVSLQETLKTVGEKILELIKSQQSVWGSVQN